MDFIGGNFGGSVHEMRAETSAEGLTWRVNPGSVCVLHAIRSIP